MINPKNLFTYATSELSQDAFLCWLFAHVGKASETGAFADYVLKDFLGVPSPSKVALEGNISKQVHSSDISFNCLVDGQPYLLVIEDKGTSALHNHAGSDKNQLAAYEDAFKDDLAKEGKNRTFRGALYKTELFDPSEADFIANFSHQDNAWKFYDIEGIIALFLNSDAPQVRSSEILASYLERLASYRSALDFDNPTNQVTNWKVWEDELWNVPWAKIAKHLCQRFASDNEGIKGYYCWYTGKYVDIFFHKEGQSRLPHVEFCPKQFENKGRYRIRYLIKAWGDNGNAWKPQQENLKAWRQVAADVFKISVNELEETGAMNRYEDGGKPSKEICSVDDPLDLKDLPTPNELEEKIYQRVHDLLLGFDKATVTREK